jgi:teichuronic acid exporter
MSLQKKTLNSLLWSFGEQAGNKVIHFIVGIILARLLAPEQFGLIGMITIFLTISQTVASGGLSQALIRKKNCSTEDYNTTFITNLGAGILLYVIFYFTSGLIANFYNEPQLELIIKVIFITLLMDSLSFVQRTKIYKNVDFKNLAKINVISQSISGVIAIFMAYNGFGVWSLVVKIVLNRGIIALLLFVNNKWFPRLTFSKESFRELFGFGYKMLFSNLIERTFKRVYYLIIGKVYSASLLGFYTRSEQFKSLVAEQLTSTIQRVTLPVLANIQDDEKRLKSAFQKMLSSSLLVSAFFMVGLVVIAQPMILFLIGEKWEQSISFLQILAFSGILYPASQLNLNILQVKGRSDLILKLQTIKKTVAIPVIITSAIISIEMMLYALILISVMDFIADSYYSKKLIGFSTINQVKQIIPVILILFVSSAASLFFLSKVGGIHQSLRLIISGSIYLSVTFLLLELFKNSAYRQVKDTVYQYLKK